MSIAVANLVSHGIRYCREDWVTWTDMLTLHQPVFNASIPDGGNPLEVDVNAPYVGLEFHYVYQLIMGGLVFLIIPG
jgi:hypothetical protein